MCISPQLKIIFFEFEKGNKTPKALSRPTKHIYHDVQFEVFAFLTWISNLIMHQDNLVGLLKQIAGPHPQSFWISKPGVRRENLHF